MDSIEPIELRDLMQKRGATGAPVIIDVREPWEWAQCRIEGAVQIPLAELPGALPRLDPAALTVVLCHHGVRSLQAASYLSRQGFQHVLNLAGGVDAWARDVDPQMARY